MHRKGSRLALLVLGLSAGYPCISVAQSCGPTQIELVADLCTPFAEILVAEVRLTDPSLPVVGGQFFIEYSFTNFALIDYDAGDSPIDSLLFFDDTTPGFIEMLVGAFFGSTQDDLVIARLTFEVIHDAGEPFIRFYFPGGELRTVIAAEGGMPLFPISRDTGSEDTDIHDFADFQNCFSGDGEAPSDCRCVFDSDGDLDVDLEDWATWGNSVMGPSGLGCGP